MQRRGWIALLGWVLACGAEAPPRSGGPAAGWPAVGGDAGGSRYSPLGEITSDNVQHLELAWEYRTGDLRDAAVEGRNHAFQSTPILVGDALIFCTPRSRVIALDAETGEERWVHDPKVDLGIGNYTLTCRGVASWDDGLPSFRTRICSSRIYVATADARLLSLDARTGRRCPDFGNGGAVDLSLATAPPHDRSEHGMSSGPVVVGDVVVVGSAIREGNRINMPSGAVQAFDARSGAKLWSWDPIPRDPDDPVRAGWQGNSADIYGGANAWSLLSVDEERGLVFVPTSSPSADYYGGERKGDNRWADSVVALRGTTGELVWGFQTVHHNLWDYDVASQPVLVDLERDGETIPAVVQATKMGHVFFLHRETGQPLFPVEERPVPQTDIPGEWTSPTQPFPTWPPPLVPQTLGPEEVWGFTFWDRGKCREQVEAMRSEGVFTPPSFEGSVLYPGTAGGSNWGSVAFDFERQLLIANTNNIANTVQLYPREEANFGRDQDSFVGRFEMRGTPYVARFGVLLSPWGIPCTAPPWGELRVLDVGKREERWRVPLGTTRDLAPLGLSISFGVPGMGGPIVTAGGVIFVGATVDSYLRAFDLETGEELWKASLPAGGQATPMTFRIHEDARQFVVIAAGGHAQMRTAGGDSLMAFSLP